MNTGRRASEAHAHNGWPLHSGGVPSSPVLRLQIVREFATAVYGKELAAAAWLGQPHDAILDGACIVATACQTEEGFEQAMRELTRIRKLRTDSHSPPLTAPPASAPPPHHGGNPRNR